MRQVKFTGIILVLLASFLAVPSLVSAEDAQEPAPSPSWEPAQIAILKYWLQKAPEDGLPELSTSRLDRAMEAADEASIDAEASALALKFARNQLLGAASQGSRAGWHIQDTDASIDLESRLDAALAARNIERFLVGLRPQHPQYEALRSAFMTETDKDRRRTIARNMERWRWMPRALGMDYVLVNAANFEAGLWRGGERAGTWRVIVGKTRTPTPVFSATITGVILNPWWEVPASIVRESVGGLVRRNPALARARGYVWSGGRYRQRPGPNNALGQMKLVMPNPYTVYMHDTPSKQLFEEDKRAFSHGCIRVGNAMDFAATLLEGVKTREEIDAIVESRKTTEIDIAKRTPVYVTYFTAVARDDGTVDILEDIYGRDRRISVQAGRGTGQAIARTETSQRTSLAMCATDAADLLSSPVSEKVGA